MALNRSAKSRILRRYFPGMTRNSEMSTEPNAPSPFLGLRRKKLSPLELLGSPFPPPITCRGGIENSSMAI